MGKVSSRADVIADWEELLQAVQSNPDLQPSVDAERQSLAQSLSDLQGLRARQIEMTALRQDSTQQIKAVEEKGKETAIKIRSVLRGKVGPKSERLVHFKIAPLRKRPRKAKNAAAKKPETAKKPAEETPGAHPGPSTSSTGGSAA